MAYVMTKYLHHFVCLLIICFILTMVFIIQKDVWPVCTPRTELLRNISLFHGVIKRTKKKIHFVLLISPRAKKKKRKNKRMEKRKIRQMNSKSSVTILVVKKQR